VRGSPPQDRKGGARIFAHLPKRHHDWAKIRILPCRQALKAALGIISQRCNLVNGSACTTMGVRQALWLPSCGMPIH